MCAKELGGGASIIVPSTEWEAVGGSGFCQEEKMRSPSELGGYRTRRTGQPARRGARGEDGNGGIPAPRRSDTTRVQERAGWGEGWQAGPHLQQPADGVVVFPRGLQLLREYVNLRSEEQTTGATSAHAL